MRGIGWTLPACHGCDVVEPVRHKNAGLPLDVDPGAADSFKGERSERFLADAFWDVGKFHWAKSIPLAAFWRTLPHRGVWIGAVPTRGRLMFVLPPEMSIFRLAPELGVFGCRA